MFTILPEDWNGEGFAAAQGSAVLRDGRAVSSPPPRADFLRPFAMGARKVADLLATYVLAGDIATPDFPAHWPHARLTAARLSQAALELRDSIAATYCMRARVKRNAPPRDLKVHEIINHIATFEQNLELHSLHDCARVFVEHEGHNLPAAIVARFRRSSAAIRAAFDEESAAEADAAGAKEWAYEGGIVGDTNRERFLTLKRAGMERFTFSDLRRIGFIDRKATDEQITSAVRELVAALRNWIHATHDCGKIRGENAIFFRRLRAENKS